MHKNIIKQIEALGGRVVESRTDSLFDKISAIKFPHVLYDQEWDVYGIDAFYERNCDLFHTAPSEFYAALEAEYFSETEKPLGQSFWRNQLFTPLTPNTDDFNEWSADFVEQDEGGVNLKPIRNIVGDGELEFVLILYAFGFPDHVYICLQDPNPEDPTVFGTDHVEFFDEYAVIEPLSQFLERFLTKAAFRNIVKEYLADKLINR